jgi:hypothetical protein
VLRTASFGRSFSDVRPTEAGKPGKYGQKQKKIPKKPQNNGKITTFCLDFAYSNVAR